MKLLVTGGKGLVGCAINADVKLGREYDLTNPQETNKAIEYHKPTHIIHCAGKVGGVGGNMNYKGEYFYDNLMINTNVIEAARKNGVENLVAFLSTCVSQSRSVSHKHKDNLNYEVLLNELDPQLKDRLHYLGIHR